MGMFDPKPASEFSFGERVFFPNSKGDSIDKTWAISYVKPDGKIVLRKYKGRTTEVSPNRKLKLAFYVWI